MVQSVKVARVSKPVGKGRRTFESGTTGLETYATLPHSLAVLKRADSVLPRADAIPSITPLAAHTPKRFAHPPEAEST